MYYYKFVDWEVPAPNENCNYEENCLKPYKEGNYFCVQSLIQHGYYKLGGYIYSFRDELKKFLYKQYGQWYEGYAPNKTLLRKNVYGRIEKIIEMED